MLVLGIETATSDLGVAVVGSHGVEAEYRIRRGRAHSEHLGPAIVRILDDLQIELDAIEGIAVSSGPGSFTGVRIGMALAQGLAYARSIPLAGVMTLEALAHAAGQFCPVVCAAVAAGRGLVYAALFDVTGDDVRIRGPIEHCRPDRVHDLVQNETGPVIVIGAPAPDQRTVIPGGGDLDRVRPASIAFVGRHRLMAGPPVHQYSVRPVYVAAGVSKS